MRKAVSVFLILAMLCSFGACGFGKSSETEKEMLKNNELLQEETVRRIQS